MASEKITNDITVYGTAKEIATAKDVILSVVPILTGIEGKDRIRIAAAIDEFNLGASVLYRGNTVWNQKKLVTNFRLMVKSGDVAKMTKYTYEFLHLCCGTIAHYNQHGWIATYPTINDLRALFRGERECHPNVLAHQPHWKTDAIEIVKELNKILGVKVPERR